MKRAALRLFGVGVLVLAGLGLVLPGQAATYVWTGSNSTDWSDNANWLGGVPGVGADVIITNWDAEVLLDADTANLNSLIISNNTLTCTNWTTTINAKTVTVQSSGKIALPGWFETYPSAQMSNRIHIACVNLTVEKGGMIDADGGGYAPWDGPGAGGHAAGRMGGGGYGGRGGYGTLDGAFSYHQETAIGHPYGNAAAPLQPGSGAGAYSTGSPRSETYRVDAGAGGGAVRIEATGTVTAHGTISADGGDGTAYLSAGGSGGGIYITCGTFEGSSNGLIRARGGNANSSVDGAGGGGGGRIALQYGNLGAQSFVRFSTSPARIDWASADLDHRHHAMPRMGTLWLPDTDLLDGELSENQFTDCRIMGPTSWSPASLVVSNCAVTFGEDGFELRVDGDIEIGTNGVLGIGDDEQGTNFMLLCGGSLTLTNGGSLWVYAGSTNALSPDYGALVAVTNDLVVGPSSWIYPVCAESNGASPRFVMDNLSVAAGGGINANSRGYFSTVGPGVGIGSTGTLNQDGSGHGGGGGGMADASTDANRGGPTYGSVTVPLAPGSGGSQYVNRGVMGGGGGGVIRVEARDAVTVNGTLTVNAGRALGDHGSGGSGGSVYVKCDGAFGGISAGLISAQGGSIHPSFVAHGAGGGGRIAVDYGSLGGTHDVRFTAAAGTRERTTVLHDEITYHHYRAQEGTLWLKDNGMLTATLDGQFDEVRIFGPTSWSVTDLTVSNCTVILAEPNFALNVANNVRIDANAWFGIGDKSAGSNVVMKVGNNLVVTNGGGFHVYSGVTGSVGKAYGILVKVTNDIAIGPNSWIYPYSHATDGGSPKFVCADMFIVNGGGFNAQARGYGACKGPGTAGTATAAGGGGGAYGGRGGAGWYSSHTERGGRPYGSPHRPQMPGSGGGAYQMTYSTVGGPGGGLVWVDASGTVTVNGTINVDGYDSIKVLGGGGAGGGIYINCNTFGGSADGLLTAEGGNAPSTKTGGGGGGRIAADYANLDATHAMRFSAAPATVSWALTDPANLWQDIPMPGTLSLPDGELLGETLNSARFAGACSLWFQDIPDWKVQSLTVNGCWVGFGQDASQLTVSNDLVVGTGGELALGEYSYGSNTTLAVGGSLILTNSGKLHVYGGLTNAMGEGDVSAIVAITNDLVVRSGSWIYPASHRDDGGSPVFRARDVLIDNGGGFNADCKGYRGMTGPGKGVDAGAVYPSGGGYGGKGGTGPSGVPAGGPTYGLTNGPALPGSGGAAHTTYPPYEEAAAGGGPVRIEARRTANVDGTITANGSKYTLANDWFAGAAGGGIYIVCSNFQGAATGLMQAKGGDAVHASGGAGGGGRVTVWDNVPYEDRTNYLAGGSEPELQIGEVFADFWGSLSVTNGAGWMGAGRAELGTRHYIRKAAAGAWELRIEGDPGMYDSPAPLGYGVNPDIPTNSWITNSVTSPWDEGGGLRRACIGYDLEDYDANALGSGISTQAGFQLTTNIVLTWNWTNEWLLTVTTNPAANGTVNWATVNGWYTNDVVVNVITATPNGGFIFNGWLGDYPAGHAADNPLAVTMDQARWVTATFAVATIETNIWDGTGLWSNESFWSEGHVPKNIDHVVVKTGSLTMDSAKYMTSLTVSNGATLLFTNWTTKAYVMDDVTVLSNGLITAWGPVKTGQMSNRVYLVCANLTVQPGGSIGVKGKGYQGWYGPGAGGHDSTYYQRGGSYGGRGGAGYRNTTDTTNGAHFYGSAAQPVHLGSGGGSYYDEARRGYAGSGGGAIRVEASAAVTVNGTVDADGRDAVTEDLAAAGSGGSIWITCNTLGGSGVIRSRGGDALSSAGSGGGGGGRIAVDYNSLAATRDLQFSTAPARVDWGAADPDQRWPHAARMGTLWLPDTNLLASPITDNLFSNCCLVIDGVTSMQVPSLTVSNTAFTFAGNRFELRVSGDLTVGTGGALGIGDYYERNGSNFVLACGGSITLTNGGELHVYAGETNGVAGDEGTLVTVTNDILVGPSSWIFAYSQQTNGGAPRFVMQNLSIGTGGGINANGRGYISKNGPSPGKYTFQAGGAGHGGRGGSAPGDGNLVPWGGAEYDSVEAPVEPGSGGQTYPYQTMNGGSGGGVVRVEARGAVTVDGTVMADGASVHGSPHGAAGAGGSVYIQCDAFGGAGGLIRVDGGDTVSTNWSGPGGGGRIAVDYNSLDGSPTVAFSAAPGINGWHTAPHAVEDRWQHGPQAGTLCLTDTGLMKSPMTEALFAGPTRVYFKDVSSWTTAGLTVSNCSVNFADDEFVLTVTGDLRVDAGGELGIGDDSDGSNYVLHCGNLVVTNGGGLYAYAGVTNSSAQAYGTVVTVDNALVVGPSSWVYPVAHRHNGATVLFEAGDVTVAAGGGFNANSKGYASWLGPGHGEYGASTTGSGGGYGGRGGDGGTHVTQAPYPPGTGGLPYGSTNAPVQPGSGGGTHGTGNYEVTAGSGGGSVRVDARGTITLRGTMTANGGQGEYPQYAGGGSGGGIYLFCSKFRSDASGLLRAEGGDSHYGSGYAGPGGGGRVAVWEGISEPNRAIILAGGSVDRLLITNDLSVAFAGVVSVDYGVGYMSAINPPTNGTTRYLTRASSAGTVIMVR